MLYRVGLLGMNSLHFCMSERVSISSPLLENVFAEHRILAWLFLFIYLSSYLHLAVLCLCCCMWAFSSGSVISHWCGFSCCRAQVYSMSFVGVVQGCICPSYVGYSLTEDWTCVHRTGSQSLNHWTTREVLVDWLYFCFLLHSNYVTYHLAFMVLLGMKLGMSSEGWPSWKRFKLIKFHPDTPQYSPGEFTDMLQITTETFPTLTHMPLMYSSVLKWP